MYEFVLGTHNVVRWLVLLAGVYAFARACRGWMGHHHWHVQDTQAGKMYAGVISLQMLLGVILYLFLSPVTHQAFRDFGAAMRTPDIRYFAVEHLVLMIVAVGLAHNGVKRAAKATDERARHRVSAIFFGLSLVALLVGIPWFRPLMP